MLYWHHGINMAFSGDYNEYFSPATNVDAVVYLMLANDLIHELLPQASAPLNYTILEPSAFCASRENSQMSPLKDLLGLPG